MAEKTLRLIINDDDPYARVPNVALRDTRMPLAVRGFFALLLGIPRDREHSLKYFVKVAGVNKDTVCKYFRILEENGYLKRYQDRGEHGAFATNTYELYASPYPKKPDTAKPETVKPDTVLPDTVNSGTKERKNKRIIPPIIPPGGNGSAGKAVCVWKPDRFLAFWKYYRSTFCARDPSRAGERGEAAAAWDKLKPDDVMLIKLAEKLRSIMYTQQWKDGIGIKMASTYLNGIRMGKISLDDLPSPSPAASGPAAGGEPEEAWGWQ